VGATEEIIKMVKGNNGTVTPYVVMSYDKLIETRQKVLGIGHLNLFYVLRDAR